MTTETTIAVINLRRNQLIERKVTMITIKSKTNLPFFNTRLLLQCVF